MIDAGYEYKRGSFTLKVDTSIPEGISGLFGPSGSGKTTLLHNLSGFLRPMQGQISYKGEHYDHVEKRIHYPPEQRKLALVFQDPLLFPHMTVKKNILYGCGAAVTKPFYREVIDLLGVHCLAERYPYQLSGGEQQRVALARAILTQPDFLMMDEPMSSLDWETREQILLYLRKIHHKFAISILYVSHSFAEILAVAERVLLLKNGEHGDWMPPSEILTQAPALAAAQLNEIDNLYELKVRNVVQTRDTIELDWGDQPLIVSSIWETVRPTIKIGIRAHDILIARKKPLGLSARNILAANIDSIKAGQGRSLIKFNSGRQTGYVQCTASAVQDLSLKAGDRIFLVIKASAIRVLE